MSVICVLPEMVCSRLGLPEIDPRFGIAIHEICARMRSDKPTDEIACWWEETTITTHLRLAAGACALSLGLLIGSAGGAIAVADTESASSATHSQGTDVSSPSLSPASGSLGSGSSSSKHPIRTTIQNVRKKFRTRLQPNHPQLIDQSTTTVSSSPGARSSPSNTTKTDPS